MISEIDNYLQRIESSRNQMCDLLMGLSTEALNWRPTERLDDHATNSLAAMATHVAGAERFWVAEVIAQRSLPPRDRDAEFYREAVDAEPLCQLLTEAGVMTQEILSGLSLSDLETTREHQDRIVPVRWAILHVSDHMALHLGHMQITYQLWKGGEGFVAPRWFQRLPE
ncbi:MAG: DUF664 domain-containing protein [Chloroflexota bacterium]